MDRDGRRPVAIVGYNCHRMNIGDVNRNDQEVMYKTDRSSTTHRLPKIWRMKYRKCGREYGSNSCDAHIRRCPRCTPKAAPAEPLTYGERHVSPPSSFSTSASEVEWRSMRVTSGKVVSGHIVVEGEPLPDGSVVTVLAREVDESFELDATAEAELLLSLAEADRGELIPAEEVLQTFRDID